MYCRQALILCPALRALQPPQAITTQTPRITKKGQCDHQTHKVGTAQITRRDRSQQHRSPFHSVKASRLVHLRRGLQPVGFLHLWRRDIGLVRHTLGLIILRIGALLVVMMHRTTEGFGLFRSR